MSYILNKSDGSVLLTLQDGDLDFSTSIGLLGRNYTGYGEIQNENFIFLLENFANANPPARPIKGQTWFDSANNVLKVYEGTQWIPVGSATPSSTPPAEVIGSFWLKTTTNQIFVFTDTGWELVGPQGVEGFAKTRAESKIIKDTNNIDHPVIMFFINGVVEAICSSTTFSVNVSENIPGFFNIVKGINVSSLSLIQGNLSGNSTTATRFETARTINSISFDGTGNIVVKADTNNFLRRGDYLLGNDFNGSVERTWSVDATSDNIIGKVVARDSEGSFSAQQITAVAFNGVLQGNVNATSGTSFFNKIISPLIEGQQYTGNSASATRLNPGRFINGVFFNGTSNITVTANAETLTGSFINSTVTTSSLRTVGNLISLSVDNAGIEIGQGNKIKLEINSALPRIAANSSLDILTDLNPGIKFVGISEAVQTGGPAAPAILSNSANINIGGPARKFDRVYANLFEGNANTATRLQTGRTINGVLFDGTQNIIIADNTKLPSVGGTVTGNLTVNGKLTLPQAPTAGTDAVNKNYVDTLVASRPLFFSLDARGLNIAGTGPGSVVSILNTLAPPGNLIAGTICRVQGTIQNVSSFTNVSLGYRIAFVRSVAVSVSTTVNNPTRFNNLVYQVNGARTSWVYVSG
jgi:hypothetical protein